MMGWQAWTFRFNSTNFKITIYTAGRCKAWNDTKVSVVNEARRLRIFFLIPLQA